MSLNTSQTGLTNTLPGYKIENTPAGYFVYAEEKYCSDEEANCLEEEKTGCNCEKHTIRTEEERRKLINRLSRIEGQIRGIKGMLERDAYCPDILTQSAAVNAAVNAFNKELLASHIRHCVVRDMREGHDEVIDELLTTLQKLMK